jgi:hypothetical protein
MVAMQWWASRLSLFAALLVAGLAGWSAWRGYALSGETGSAPPGAGLCVERPDRDLGDVPVGEHIVGFAITNPSAAECRILGVRGLCGLTCCFEPVDDVPVAIRSGQTYTLLCKVRILKSGPFDGAVPVFVDDGGAREIRLTVRGVGIVSD